MSVRAVLHLECRDCGRTEAVILLGALPDRQRAMLAERAGREWESA